MVDEARVGIVGSGIGGAAAAWYLQNMTAGTALEGRVRSVVFESLNRVGGRLYAMEMGGNRLNVGGDAWAQVNWYVRELAAAVELPLETSFYGGNDLFGLYEGDGRWVANATRLLESASSDWGMIQALAETEMALSKNYKSRGMQPFDTIGAFLQYGSLEEFTTQETQRFLSDKGVAQPFVDTLIGPLCQVIYDQTPSMQAFAGMVSVLSVTSTPYSALDGNDNLPRTLLQQAPSTSLLLSTTVLSLGLSSNASPLMNNSSPIYLVTIVDNNSGVVKTLEFDAVIIAAPLEWSAIKLQPNLQVPQWSPRKWVRWVVTLVEAQGLQPAYFGRDPVPDQIICSLNSSAPFVKVSAVALSNRTTPDGPVYKIYSLFSEEAISPAVLDQMFARRVDTLQYSWPFTFPVLDVITDPSSPSSYQPLILHDRLFSNNAMESVASAMEGSVISARNSVLSLLSTF